MFFYLCSDSRFRSCPHEVLSAEQRVVLTISSKHQARKGLTDIRLWATALVVPLARGPYLILQKNLAKTNLPALKMLLRIKTFWHNEFHTKYKYSNEPKIYEVAGFMSTQFRMVPQIYSLPQTQGSSGHNKRRKTADNGL